MLQNADPSEHLKGKKIGVHVFNVEWLVREKEKIGRQKMIRADVRRVFLL